MSIQIYTSPSIQHQEKIANLPFAENRATADTAQTLRDELLFHRATQTYLWGLPLINTLGMQVGSEKRRRTGSPRSPEKGTSPFCGSTGLPSRRSRRPGSPAT
jgi:hypothetical protein